MKTKSLNLIVAILSLFMVYSCQKAQVKPLVGVEAIAKVDSSVEPGIRAG